MSAEKVFYGPIDEPEKPSRRERVVGPRVFLVGVFGVIAVLTAVVVLAMVLNNISQKMARDHEEIMILKASAERDHEEIADLKASAEKGRLQNGFLMERIMAVLESQTPSRDEHQMPDTGSVQSLEAGHSGDAAAAANAEAPSNNDTVKEVQNKRSRRSVSNWDELLTKLSDLQGELGDANEFQTRQSTTGGAVYVRWGRKDCPSRTRLVYRGFAGGSSTSGNGGGANYVCLPEEPQWGNYKDGFQSYTAYMYGGEYYLYSEVPFGSKSLHYHNVPCAVCHAQNRGSKVMIPARNTCFPGWNDEYHGYLMASYRSAGAKEFACVDEQAQAAIGGHLSQSGALFYPVEAYCGALLCPPYVNGRELTCVVCTK